MIAQDIALEHVLISWDHAELSVEERLNNLRNYVFQKAGLEHTDAYYKSEGKALHRYLAGFINRYFTLLKDASFILLDPLHILDVIWSFIKNALLHPLKTIKRIWSVWTGLFTLGSYGVGMLTADAFLAAIIAGLGALLQGGQILEVMSEAAVTFGEKAVGGVTSLPKKIANIANSAQYALTNTEDIFHLIQHQPDKILLAAEDTLMAKATYKGVRTYKVYTNTMRAKRNLA